MEFNYVAFLYTEDTNNGIALLVERKMPMPCPCGLGCRTTSVQSGPIALELWLYNNPLFTYTAEAVKTTDRFLAAGS